MLTAGRTLHAVKLSHSFNLLYSLRASLRISESGMELHQLAVVNLHASERTDQARLSALRFAVTAADSIATVITPSRWRAANAAAKRLFLRVIFYNPCNHILYSWR